MLTLIKSETQATAHSYILKGWWVMPVMPNDKEPHFDLIKRAHLDATNDTTTLDYWFNKDPEMNIGINCQQSGLVVLDIDYRNGGKFENFMLDTFTVATGDGLHLYYRAEPGASYRGKLGEGVDIKHKGFVVAAPSIHSNGNQYQVIHNVEPKPLNKELREMITK
jgi:hypothetical protein